MKMSGFNRGASLLLLAGAIMGCAVILGNDKDYREIDAGTGTGGAGGSGGVRGSSTSTSSSGNTGSGGSSSGMESSSSGMICGSVYKCADAIAPGGDPAKLCTDSLTLYVALVKCTCMGACMTKCASSFCAMKPVDAMCDTCIHDPAGCGKEWQSCNNDV